MATLTTTTEISSALSEYYDRNLLERAVEENLHDQFAQVRPMKARNGLTIKFRRYNGLAPATTPLTEGVTPSGSQLSKTDVTAVIQQYGDFVTVTDVVDYTNPDPVLTEAGKVLGEQMGETRDLLIRDVINAGSAVFYVADATETSGASRTAVNAPISDASIRVALTALRAAKAKTIKELLKASVGINTQPIAPSYAAITHTNNIYKVKALTNFVEPQNYARTDDLMKNEFGAVDQIRFCWTNNAKVWTGAGAGTPGKDVYSTLIIGRDAYGVVPLEKGTARNIIKPLGSGGTDDPLEQRATSGWKMMFTSVILNDGFMYRIESALS